jgi:predicted alpha/beta-hydrolase family hydrolase
MVETRPWLVFRPTDPQPSTGLILYPGGRVDCRAYAPAAQAIAAKGYLVAIVPMPLNLAVFGAGKAEAVINAHPEVTRWAIGGHSLGGAMAAQFARRQPDQIRGLVLWASYPSGSDDLSGSSLLVTSISGTRDGLSTPAKIEASRPLLPADTQWVAIDGGNHAQFGWYGRQAGDGEATIGREEQQRRIVEATLELLGRVQGTP